MRAFSKLFNTLDELETRLGKNRYLVGGVITRQIGDCFRH